MAGDASKALQAGAWTRNWSRQGVRLTALAVLAVVTLLAFMTLGVEADWAFVLQHRGTKALTMLLFGMMNWMFTWLKPQGALSYDTMAPVVADLFLGGLGAVQTPGQKR